MDALTAVRARIASTGRDPDEVTIVAVTKGHPIGVVRAAADAGLLDIGENQAQELLAKVDDGVPLGVRWHFLGPVQRNKVKKLAAHVALWQAVDRGAAGEELARHRPGAAVLVQVNLSGDEARPGCGWDDAPRLVERLRAGGLEVRGLMGVATRGGDARREFRRLATLRRDLHLDELSIGMSGDLEVGVEEGATIVRVGSSLFGARPEAGR
ncbi:MAG TPA: YggS family pyridoxal phosphate-dependent enzyme [Acidimicrobiales bacterium]|nr:YggS family pyridoxal phosphate-dependent enzyme [Acidimicrobiales bacterium]